MPQQQPQYDNETLTVAAKAEYVRQICMPTRNRVQRPYLAVEPVLATRTPMPGGFVSVSAKPESKYPPHECTSSEEAIESL